MTVMAAVVRELIAAGVTGDALVTAIERIEAAMQDEPKASSGAKRTRKWREGKASRETSQASQTVTVTPPPSPSSSPLTLSLITTPSPDAPVGAPTDLEKQLFERGKQVLGKSAGGFIARLLKAKSGNIALARAAIEQASTKQNPREYLAAIITGGTASAEGRRLSADEEFYGTGRIPGII